MKYTPLLRELVNKITSTFRDFRSTGSLQMEPIKIKHEKSRHKPPFMN